VLCVGVVLRHRQSTDATVSGGAETAEENRR
jgi:hypothetical protein